MRRVLSFILTAALVVCCPALPAQAVQLPDSMVELCSAEEWQLLKLTNRQRLARGLEPFSIFPTLQSAAYVRKNELVTLYSHSRPNGSECFTALTDAGLGYYTAGENIAAGQKTAETVFQAWMNSTGHQDNILSSKFSHLGVGYTAGGFLGHSWVQMFLSKDCSVSSIRLSDQSVTCSGGTTPGSLDLYITAECPVHGSCYLPLLDEMCQGFDPNFHGEQSVTVTYGGKTAKLQVNASSPSLNTAGADSWAVDWLNRADALGLLSDRNRSNFAANITRLQFADLSVRLVESLTGGQISPAPDGTFTDTDETIVRQAKSAGIVSGYEVNGSYEFRPDAPITRQEICVMLSNAVTYALAAGITPAGLDRSETLSGAFRDGGEVASWALKPVALMCNNGVMSGRSGSTGLMLAPLSPTTLQEGATLTVKLYDLMR